MLWLLNSLETCCIHQVYECDSQLSTIISFLNPRHKLFCSDGKGLNTSYPAAITNANKRTTANPAPIKPPLSPNPFPVHRIYAITKAPHLLT